MAGVYSKRFILGFTPSALTYTPPAGKRAVLKCVMAVNTSSRVQNASIDIGGVYLWFGAIPGPGQLTASGLHVVFDHGETLKIGGSIDISVCASGYELDAT